MEHPLEKRFPVDADDYKLYEEVGEGVGATVYRALCIPLNEIVAIKVLDLEKCNNDVSLQLYGIKSWYQHKMSVLEKRRMAFEESEGVNSPNWEGVMPLEIDTTSSGPWTEMVEDTMVKIPGKVALWTPQAIQELKRYPPPMTTALPPVHDCITLTRLFASDKSRK
ncbi:hypothetical protein F3Y22_tig00110402pilonHSYRG00033 [Hibiscus syriacus]|uniref:Protein kinase domain-containing protein n=1 Tax=Hibiscus syriacus TaxID=106335 RepID=A0A6A3ATM8_HIBSY|nr:hypothetical protein F3Y22_tig00110402pilonHSYRG00033 [Hibiscus syriacus]